MIVSMKSWPSLKPGHVRSKTRSLGQIFEKPCEHSSSYIYGPIIMKVGQKDRQNEILAMFETGSCGVKN